MAKFARNICNSRIVKLSKEENFMRTKERGHHKNGAFECVCVCVLHLEMLAYL